MKRPGDDIEKILLDEETIDKRITEMAAEIDKYYADSERALVLMCTLNGAVVFLTDIMRKLTVDCEIDFMKVSSYGHGTVSGGKVNILLDCSKADLSNTDILIVEDIIDSGRTLNYLMEYFRFKGAASVRLCALLDKPSRRIPGINVKPDYVGFEIPDEFVVGYGLDFADRYRTLPYVGILRPEIYETKQNEKPNGDNE